MSTPSAIDLYAIVKCQAYVRGYLQRQTYKWISTSKTPTCDFLNVPHFSALVW